MTTKYSPTSQITEDVLRAFRDGDHEAYGMIYLQFVNPLMAFIKSLVKQQSVAEDLTQEIMAEVWAKRMRIDIHTSVNSYLFAIARNAVSNYFRSKHSTVSIDGESKWLATHGNTQSSDDTLIANETNRLVDDIVSKMPKQRRTIFSLKNDENLSNESIAEILGISKKAVEKQISYARREIRKLT
jgi:RNA polymerase sigma-70 factor (ECF subfamily)